MRSYSPKRGWSSTISLTLSSSLYTSCSLAGAVLMSTNPIATPGHRAGKLLTQYNPFVAAFEPLGISVFSIRMAHIFSHVAGLRPRRQMRLRALRFDDETCHGRAQDAAMPEVETAG